MIDDLQLAPHFKLSEYLMTGRPEFQAQNKIVTSAQIEKLRQLALLEEKIRTVLGCKIENHSGYRCPELNNAIGSSSRSQHMLCEAVDFSRSGFVDTPDTIEQDFRKIVAAARQGQFKFGQLIKEQASRYTRKNGTVVDVWLHVSLGAPYRPAERSGQLLTMRNGIYTSLGVV